MNKDVPVAHDDRVRQELFWGWLDQKLQVFTRRLLEQVLFERAARADRGWMERATGWTFRLA